jgi:hypothetical protein
MVEERRFEFASIALKAGDSNESRDKTYSVVEIKGNMYARTGKLRNKTHEYYHHD